MSRLGKEITADQEEKLEPNPRLSKTSQKAGKTSGLEFGRKFKTEQSRNLKQRILKAEKQTEGLKNELEEFLEAEKLKEISESELEAEVSKSQTNRELSKMGERDKKTMPIPGSRDAPKFSSTKPKELRRFITQLEDLWKEAEVTEGREKKQSLGKYADQDTEEEWKALETFDDGYSWAEFKKELLDNYPEASAAERGTPARIRQIVREADKIELGDTAKLYTYRRAFLAEAKKLQKSPAVMSNRELVELFMGGLSMSMGQAILQYLGNISTKGKETRVPEQRRPEDRYDLEEVCRAAGEVSENAQGMLSYNWGSLTTVHSQKRGTTLVQTTPGESSILAGKLESLEESQALEKDRLNAVNKQWGAKLESLEGLMKTLISQSQEKPVAGFIQNGGNGWNRSGVQNDESGKNFRHMSSNSDIICFGCGETGHFQNICERVKALIAKGTIIRNREGRVCLPDGSRVPNVPAGASLVERLERYYGTMKTAQAYMGTFEEVEDKMGGTLPRESSYMNREVDDRELRLSKLEKEFELKERENVLLAKQLKLENKISEKPDMRSYLLEKFDEELSALQNNKSGFQ